MNSLFVKEIRSFLSSLIGYIVIVVFLLAISLFMWIIRGGTNVLDVGYANIDTLFSIGPWVFLFLIPAITMRSFADEKNPEQLNCSSPARLLICRSFWQSISRGLFSLRFPFSRHWSTTIPYGVWVKCKETSIQAERGALTSVYFFSVLLLLQSESSVRPLPITRLFRSSCHLRCVSFSTPASSNSVHYHSLVKQIHSFNPSASTNITTRSVAV